MNLQYSTKDENFRQERLAQEAESLLNFIFQKNLELNEISVYQKTFCKMMGFFKTDFWII